MCSLLRNYIYAKNSVRGILNIMLNLYKNNLTLTNKVVLVMLLLV